MASWASSTLLISTYSIVCGSKSWFRISRRSSEYLNDCSVNGDCDMVDGARNLDSARDSACLGHKRDNGAKHGDKRSDGATITCEWPALTRIALGEWRARGHNPPSYPHLDNDRPYSWSPKPLMEAHSGELLCSLCLTRCSAGQRLTSSSAGLRRSILLAMAYHAG